MKLRDALGHVVVPTLQAKLNRQQSVGLLERSMTRWQNALPDVHLTMGETLSGAPFVEVLAKHYPFSESTRVLEIGPGYGRLLKALLDAGTAFGSYTGLEVSRTSVEYLSRTFGSEKVRFVNGTARDPAIRIPFDVAFASLTFQHFYPTFRGELANLFRQASDRAKVIFDVPERRWFFPFSEYWSARDGYTSFIRVYSRHDVESTVDAAGGGLECFDRVAMQGVGDLRLVAVCRAA
jgi:SAM-dependent methyltransferase